MSGNGTGILLAIGVLLFLLPGVAGITLGGPSAQAGWWLVVVGAILVGVALVRRARLPS